MKSPLRKSLTLAVLLLPFSASAWLMTETGPEPGLVQIKQSIRLDPNLDAELQDLAALEASLGVSIAKLWVNPDVYIQQLIFPADFTEEQALAVASNLLQSPSVQQVVPVSAFNLVFQPAQFVGEFGPNDSIPEAVLRGLDTPPAQPVNPGVLNTPHVPNQLIVSWKPEFVWNAAQTGFLETMADFNAAAGCQVVDQISSTTTELTQVLEFDPRRVSLLEELVRYTDSGLVRYAEPNFIYFLDGSNGNVQTPDHSHRAHKHKRGKMHHTPMLSAPLQ